MPYRYQQSVFKCYHSDQLFSEFLPTRWRQKSADTDMEQNYVTVTLYSIRCGHCYIHSVVCLRLCLLAQGTITVLDGARIYH